jgi:hypothetical protein
MKDIDHHLMTHFEYHMFDDRFRFEAVVKKGKIEQV